MPDAHLHYSLCWLLLEALIHFLFDQMQEKQVLTQSGELETLTWLQFLCFEAAKSLKLWDRIWNPHVSTTLHEETPALALPPQTRDREQEPISFPGSKAGVLVPGPTDEGWDPSRSRLRSRVSWTSAVHPQVRGPPVFRGQKTHLLDLTTFWGTSAEVPQRLARPGRIRAELIM